MKSNNKKKIIVTSIAVAIVVILTAVAITLVLVLGKNDGGPLGPIDHIEQDGSLNLKLERESLISDVLGDKGWNELKTDNRVTDFTNSTSNIFGLTGSSYLAPDSSVEAVMKVSNTGENAVPFAYWLSIELAGEANSLASQLKATVTINGSDVTFYLSEGLNFGSQTSPAARISVGEVSSFTVKIEYDRLTATNDSQGETVYFDLIVHAFQTR